MRPFPVVRLSDETFVNTDRLELASRNDILDVAPSTDPIILRHFDLQLIKPL